MKWNNSNISVLPLSHEEKWIHGHIIIHRLGWEINFAIVVQIGAEFHFTIKKEK